MGGVNNEDDFFGSSGLLELSNQTIIVRSPIDTIGGITSVGTVSIIDLMGNSIAYLTPASAGGTNDSIDAFGSSGLFELANGNIMIASSGDDVGGIANLGSVSLFRSDGNPIAYLTPSSVGGTDEIGDAFSHNGIMILANNNIAIASSRDNIGGVSRVGSVTIIDQDGASLAFLTPAEFGGTNEVDDQFSSSGLIALASGAVAISSSNENMNGVMDVGSLSIANGLGDPVLYLGPSTLAGTNDVNDFFGDAQSKLLSNGNILIRSSRDDVGGTTDAGSVSIIPTDAY